MARGAATWHTTQRRSFLMQIQDKCTKITGCNLKKLKELLYDGSDFFYFTWIVFYIVGKKHEFRTRWIIVIFVTGQFNIG